MKQTKQKRFGKAAWVNGCHVLTITDEYGDGMFGSQWGSCDVDGDYVFTTAEGAVIVAMGDPDYGDAISHEFCLPVVPGCTDAGACNFSEDANADDGSCYSAGDACDDGDEEARCWMRTRLIANAQGVPALRVA